VSKGPEAFRTISEVAEALDLPQHVLRFWETRFTQIKPLKRGGGRRYYRPDDVDLLRGIRQLLYGEGFTIKGVQRILKEHGPRFVISAGRVELDGKSALAQRSEPVRKSGGRAVEAPAVDDELFAEPDDAERDDGADVVPRVEVPASARDASQPDIGGKSRSASPKLTGEEVRVLKATLAELLECRRLLDETH